MTNFRMKLRVGALLLGGLNVGCGSGGGSAPSASNLTCPSSSQCSQSEIQQYGTCIENACDSAYTTCFGSGYKNAMFSGPCGTYYNCLAACSCNDNGCRTNCGIAPADCQLCIGNTITPCVQSSGCTEPACGGSTGTGGTTGTNQLTCADLMTCCAAIKDATQKSVCQMEYTLALPDGNVICDPFVRGYKEEGLCP
jgi:hypothetical protein